MLNGFLTVFNSKAKQNNTFQQSVDLITIGDNDEEIDTWSSPPLDKLIKVLIIDYDDISVKVLECMFQKRITFEYKPWLLDVHSLDEYLSNCVITPQLVVLDISNYEALDIVKFIRTKFSRSTLPILLSATSRHEDRIYDCLDVGANDFVYKPFRYRELNYRVSNLLQMSKFIRKDSILSDILPNEIIENLEHGINFMAKYHPQVTILFSDRIWTRWES